MNPNNTLMIKNSFFIENILSKPDKNPTADENQWESPSFDEKSISSDHSGHFPNDGIVTKAEISEHCVEHLNDGIDDECKQNPRNNFTSPDSSEGCDDEIVDNMSDINPEENCKWTFMAFSILH